MNNINKLIEELEKIKPYNPSQNITLIESNLNKCSNYLIISSFIMLLTFFTLSVYHYFLTLSNTFITIAIVIYLLTITLSSIALLLNLLGFLFSKLSKNKEWYDSFLFEINHDENAALVFMKCNFYELEYLTHWLNLKKNRLNNRIVNFFGDNKIAFFSILVLLYTINKDFDIIDSFNNVIFQHTENFRFFNMTIILFFAFVSGVLLAAIRLKFIISQCQYKLEIIELAIKLKQDSNEAKNS